MRILLCEDEHLIAAMLRLHLQEAGYEVTWRQSGEEALAALRRCKFDLILLDVGLPGMSGIDVARAARRASVGSPIIMLTSADDAAVRLKAFDVGADDFLIKPFEMAELMARVRAQIRRSHICPQVATDHLLEVGCARLDVDRRAARTHDGIWHGLTEKEAELLGYIAQNPDRVLRRADILERVWGRGTITTDRTIDNFVLRLRRLIEPDPEQPSHLLTVRGVGYRFVPAGEHRRESLAMAS